MTYQDLINELFSKRKREGLKGPQHLKAVMESLGNPHEAYPTVHVAGTNGKGSVATKIAKTIEFAGYRVGLFTSPHIHHFNERIQIKGEEISDEDVERLLPPLLTRFPDYCFFDYATFLAFQYFNEKNVDLAVIETGIGGLLDTTNVIEPLVSVITSVAFDHIEILGPTLDDIAYQKAGIIKPKVPVVVGPKARYKPIYELAKDLKSALIEVPPQSGDYDSENQAIAKAAIGQFAHFFEVPLSALQRGLLEKPPCRFQRHGRFVMDVAHNVEGIQGLLKTWQIHHPNRKFVALMGLSSDKNLGECLTLMARSAEHLYLVSADSKRAAPLEKLEEILHERRISNFTSCPDMEKAVDLALASDHDILVCGSFYIMKQAREQIFGLKVS